MGIAKDNITAKDQSEFVKGITDGLVKIGAEIQPTDERMLSNTQFKLNTSVGVLNITLFHHQKFIFTVYAQFEDVERAKQKFNCNPHSGKYNVHIGKTKGMTGKKAVDITLDSFEMTL